MLAKLGCALLFAIVILGLSPGAATALPVDDATPRVQMQGDCGDWRSAFAPVGSWSKSTSNCFVFGSKGFKIGYDWAVAPTSESRICVQGRGFKLVDGVRRARWYSLGCGTQSFCFSDDCRLPWGNASAYPAVRAKAQPGFLGAGYRWRH